MNTSKLHIYCGILVIGLLFAACAGTTEIAKTRLKPLPESYSGTKDTANVASVNWKKYFSDPYLISLIDTALNSNLDLLMATQKIEMAKANVKLAKGLAIPGVSVIGSAGRQKFGDYTMNAAGNRGTTIYNGEGVPTHLNDFNLGLQSSWEIDCWGKLKNTKKAAVAEYLSSVEGRNWAITNLVSEIASDYYELLALDNELEIIKEGIQLQDSALSLVRVQKQAGVVNELAVKQFEAEVLGSKEMEMEVTQKISEAENQLNYILGRYPQPIARNKSALSSGIPNQVKIGIPSDLLKNRPDVKQAEYDLEASKASLKVAKSAFYPTVTITGAIGMDAYKTSLWFMPESFAYNLLGNLVAPVINRSAIKAQFRTANAAQIDAMYNYQKSILGSYIEVFNAMVNLKSVQKVLDLKTLEVNTLNEAVGSSNLLFKTGRANYLEVLNLQEHVLQSRIDQVEAMKNQYNSVVSIYRSLGGGWR